MASTANPCEVFVKGLSPETVPQTLGDTLKQYGEIEQARVITRREGDKVVSRGFGFVLYKTEQGAASAIAARNVQIEGRNCTIFKARARRPVVNAYLGRLTDQITREDILEYFKAQNPISATIKRKEINGQQTSIFGFVRFPTNEALMAAIKDLREIEIKGVKILVRRARSLPYSIRRPRRFGRGYRGGYRRNYRGRRPRQPRANVQ